MNGNEPVLLSLDNIMLDKSIYLWLYSPLLDLVFRFLNPIKSRQDSLDGGPARRRAATYIQKNINTQ
jgi:hypothetical protein